MHELSSGFDDVCAAMPKQASRYEHDPLHVSSLSFAAADFEVSNRRGLSRYTSGDDHRPIWLILDLHTVHAGR